MPERAKLEPPMHGAGVADRTTVIDPASPIQTPAMDSELAQSLYDLLYTRDLGIADLQEELAVLVEQHGQFVYSDLIHLLSHLRFEAESAEQHWQKILAHQTAMQKKLKSTVDLRVAIVSYFVDVNRQLHNPKIIELRVFEQTQASAYRDELTGLHNYRFFIEALGQEIRRGERYSTPVSLIMLDVDYFKEYNDRNGHAAGNEVLATLARLLSAPLRKLDIPARYGGEEFAVILPSTPKIGAQVVAERAREAVEQHRFPHGEEQPDGRLTISLGVATYPADALEANELVRRADRALYTAKSTGRNQVQLYGHSYRSYRRVSASLDGQWRALGTETHPLTTIDISEGGLLFLCEQKIPRDGLIDINLRLPDAKQEIAVVGRVVHAEEHGIGDYEIAVSFMAMSSRDQNQITRFVRECLPTSDAEDPASKVI